MPTHRRPLPGIADALAKLLHRLRRRQQTRAGEGKFAGSAFVHRSDSPASEGRFKNKSPGDSADRSDRNLRAMVTG
jgi:hypothetical protein